MNNKFDIHAIKIFHYFHAQEKCINTIINIYQLRLPFKVIQRVIIIIHRIDLYKPNQ